MKIKKLSILISLLLCVTIGGVYAAWIYANPSTKTHHTVGLNIGFEARNEGAIGEYTLEVDATATPFAIEPASTTDYTATLKALKSVYLVFDPADNAPQDVIDNGVDTYLYFTNATALESLKYTDDTHDNESIFTVTRYKEASEAGAAKIDMKSTDKVGNVFKIDVTDLILGSIDLIDIQLPTRDKFEDFNTALKANGDIITLSVYVTNTFVTPTT